MEKMNAYIFWLKMVTYQKSYNTIWDKFSAYINK